MTNYYHILIIKFVYTYFYCNIIYLTILKSFIFKNKKLQIFFQTSAKVSKVEHQRLLKNIDVDDFLSVVHGRKSK